MREAGEAPDIDAFVRERLSNNSAETILQYCRLFGLRGDVALAQSIATSSALREKVVPDSQQLDDGSYGPNTLPEGCIFESKFRQKLTSLGISDDAA